LYPKISTSQLLLSGLLGSYYYYEDKEGPNPLLIIM